MGVCVLSCVWAPCLDNTVPTNTRANQLLDECGWHPELGRNQLSCACKEGRVVAMGACFNYPTRIQSSGGEKSVIREDNRLTVVSPGEERVSAADGPAELLCRQAVSLCWFNCLFGWNFN